MKPPKSERGTLTGLAVRVGRAGTAPVRLVLRPARGLARSPLAGAAVRSGVDRVSATAGGVFETEAERAVDAVLAGPLPEAVARSMIDRRVGERVVTEVLANVDLEGIVASATEDERTARVVQQVLASPAMERMLVDALESKLTVELTERLLQSPELQRVVEDAVRAGLARRAATLTDQMADAGRRVDTALEAPPRRWLRRPPRPRASPGGELGRAVRGPRHARRGGSGGRPGGAHPVSDRLRDGRAPDRAHRPQSVPGPRRHACGRRVDDWSSRSTSWRSGRRPGRRPGCG